VGGRRRIRGVVRANGRRRGRFDSHLRENLLDGGGPRNLSKRRRISRQVPNSGERSQRTSLIVTRGLFTFRSERKRRGGRSHEEREEEMQTSKERE